MVSSLVNRLRCFFANCGSDIMVRQDLHTLLNRIKDLTGNSNRMKTINSKGSSGNLRKASSGEITIGFVRVCLCDGLVVEWLLSVAMNGEGSGTEAVTVGFWIWGFYGEIAKRKERNISKKESGTTGWHRETTNQV